MKKTSPIIFWFRQDLRLADNPGLAAACGEGRPVIPVYVLDDINPGPWKAGGAAQWWLHHGLGHLAHDLKSHGFHPLVFMKGDAEKEILSLVKETGAEQVYWNRLYEPWAIARDTRIKQKLAEAGIDAASFKASLLFEPWEIRNKSGGSYKVFTPFSRACLENGIQRPPISPPKKQKSTGTLVEKLSLDALRLMPASTLR